MLRFVRPAGLPVHQLVRLGRLILLLFFVVVIVLSAQLYRGVQQKLALCQDEDKWQCRLEVFLDEGESPAKAQNPDSSPIIEIPEAVESESSRLGTIEDMYGALSDAVKKPGSLSEWTYERDANDVSMSRRSCQTAFSALFKEITRTQAQYSTIHVVKGELDNITMTDGLVRAGIQNRKLFILKANLTSATRPLALGVLHSINTAISNPGPNSIPNIEFVFSVNRQVPDVESPLWVFDRQEENDMVWLMPSTGYVWERPELPQSAALKKASKGEGSEEPSKKKRPAKEEDPVRYKSDDASQGLIGVPRDQLVREIEKLEVSTPFGNKTQRLIGVWRNSPLAQNTRQRTLSRAAIGRSWAENDDTVTTVFGGLMGIDALTKAVDKQHNRDLTNQLSLSQMCRFAFLGHDSSFPISIADGPLLCSSVLLTTKPKWIELYHGLMLANRDRFDLGDAVHPVVQTWVEKGAGEENVVVMADDFGDLEFKMQGLIENPDVAEAIAMNNRKTFRERYLTNAATACYWRELIRSYATVSYKPGGWHEAVERDGGGAPVAVKRSSRSGIRWESFLMLDDDSQMVV